MSESALSSPPAGAFVKIGRGLARLPRRLAWAAALLVYAVVLVALGFRLWALWREDPAAAPPSVAASRMVGTPLGAVHVQVRGPENGSPVVLVHGAAAWSGFWTDVAVALADEGYRVAAIDLPPFGYSERRAEADYERVAQARRIREVILGLGWRDAVIVGHSLGAGPALEAAFRFPEQARGLVIVCGALGLPEPGAAPDGGGIVGALSRQGWLMQPVVAATMVNPLLTRRLLAAMIHRKETADDRQTAILGRPMVRSGTVAAYAAWLPALLQPATGALSHDPANYARFTVPTAVIWGEKDSVTPLAQGQRLGRLIAGSSLDVIPDAGHIPHIERPAAFLATLQPRLRALAAPRS